MGANGVEENCRNSARVDLGYVEELDQDSKYRVRTHHFFPTGKVGGFPAWLSLHPLPDPDLLNCGSCDEPMCFLLQIYAPLEVSEREDLFHRTIFLFVCKNPSCSEENSSKNFAAFRSQLPRKNNFYNFEPLSPDLDRSLIGAKVAQDYGNICVICGCAARKRCGRCEKASYCSKKHQTLHWTFGHKSECSKELVELGDFRNDFVFPEFEIVLEAEELDEVEEEERPEQERLHDYRKFLEKQKGKQDVSVSKDAFVDEGGEESKTDKRFKRFRYRLDQNPDQIVRYQRGAEPLWADVPDAAENAVPPCERCGAARVFEFQVTPRLLAHLGVDTLGKSIDWATVVVFTCEDSCAPADNEYAAEFVWKQDYAL